jgi:hypothetical protein
MSSAWHPPPIKERPGISAAVVAKPTDEPWLQIGKPDVIRPLVRADLDRVAAMIVRAIDQDAAHASRAHLSEGDLLRAGKIGHALLG